MALCRFSTELPCDDPLYEGYQRWGWLFDLVQSAIIVPIPYCPLIHQKATLDFLRNVGILMAIDEQFHTLDKLVTIVGGESWDLLFNL